MFTACEGNPLELLFFLFAELGNCGVRLDGDNEMIGCQLFLITLAFDRLKVASPSARYSTRSEPSALSGWG